MYYQKKGRSNFNGNVKTGVKSCWDTIELKRRLKLYFKIYSILDLKQKKIQFYIKDLFCIILRILM
jgi:hypothetical protein